MVSLFSEALDFALTKAGKDSNFKLKTESIIEANDRERALNTFLDAVKLDITTTKPKPTQDNLTVTERLAIGQLKQRQDIIIKPADKGSGTVVWTRLGTSTNATDNLLTPNSTSA